MAENAPIAEEVVEDTAAQIMTTRKKFDALVEENGN
jgi:hypothetical protein